MKASRASISESVRKLPSGIASSTGVLPVATLKRAGTMTARASSWTAGRAQKVLSVSEEHRSQVASIKAQLFERNYKSFLMHPIDSKFLPYWDATTTIALIYTAVITPWETAFITVDETRPPWGEGWFLINRLVDLIFLIDMILQFFIMYPLEQKTATSQIVYVTDRRKIANYYLLGWFPLDVRDTAVACIYVNPRAQQPALPPLPTHPLPPLDPFLFGSHDGLRTSPNLRAISLRHH